MFANVFFSLPFIPVKFISSSDQPILLVGGGVDVVGSF